MFQRFIPVSLYEQQLPLLAQYYRGQMLFNEIQKLEINYFKTQSPPEFDNKETTNYRTNAETVAYICFDFDSLCVVNRRDIRFNVNEYGKTLK